MARFLRALSVPGSAVPADADERAAAYRSELAGRRMLIVLDNARDVAQVRPLLSGSASCMTVVTSRDALAGLVARDGAVRIAVDLLPLSDAVDLLRALIGARADAAPSAVATLAARCSRLPLALRVAAELATALPHVTLDALAGELADHQRRLDLLHAAGDGHSAVRGVFSWSSRHLDPAEVRTFALAGAHPGPDFDRYAVAALAGTDAATAGRSLERLVRANLIQHAGPDRYDMHDLLRAYARELATDPPAALASLVDYYLHVTLAATTTLFTPWCLPRPHRPAYTGPVPDVGMKETARAWLDAEHANLIAVVRLAHTAWPSHTTDLTAALFPYLECGVDHTTDAITLYTLAHTAARHSGDRNAEATALTNLGVFDLQQGRYSLAVDRFQQARILFRATGDQFGEARVLGELGVIHRRHGHCDQAADHQRQALALFTAVGDRAQQALTRTRLAVIESQCGRPDRAADQNRQALNMFRAMGDQFGEAHALTRLGAAELGQGRHLLADRHQRQALALFRQLTDPSGEAEAHQGLADVLLATGQPIPARAHYAAALQLTGQTGHLYGQAHAHHGLAHTLETAGDDGQARHHLQQALVLYTSLGAPEADQIRGLPLLR